MAKSDQGASFVRVERRRRVVTLGDAIPEEERSQSGIRVTPDQQHISAVFTVRTPNHVVNVVLEPRQPQ